MNSSIMRLELVVKKAILCQTQMLGRTLPGALVQTANVRRLVCGFGRRGQERRAQATTTRSPSGLETQGADGDVA